MKGSEIVVGGKYMARVSNCVVPVEVLEIIDSARGIYPKWRNYTHYRCRNTVTGREILVKSPQRFRRPAPSDPKGVA